MALRHAARFRSKPKHVVETEDAASGEKAMIAEKPARRVAHNNIGIVAGTAARRLVEDLVIAPEERSRAGNGDAFARYFASLGIMKDEIGGARLVPGRRSRIDQMAKRIEGRF